MSATGIAMTPHIDLATGAVLAQTLIPSTQRGLGDQDGPEAYFERLRQGLSHADSLNALQREVEGMATLTTTMVRSPSLPCSALKRSSTTSRSSQSPVGPDPELLRRLDDGTRTCTSMEVP